MCRNSGKSGICVTQPPRRPRPGVSSQGVVEDVITTCSRSGWASRRSGHPRRMNRPPRNQAGSEPAD